MAGVGPDVFDILSRVGTRSNSSKSRESSEQMRHLDELYKTLGKVMGAEITGSLTEAYSKKIAKSREESERKLTKEGLELLARENKDHRAALKLAGMNFTDNFKKAGQAVVDTLSKSLGTFTRAIDTSVKAYTQIYQKYQASINARLQGSNLDFTGLSTTIQGNLMFSPYVKQTAVLENLSKLVEAGTAYNLEQRAFLASISDKIATTFDSFDSNLMQIIRIQQADSTVARLGMEAQLTNFLNKNFSDTSYLSNAYKSVSGNLLGASSTMSREQAVEFEYQVQKWLGSLGSVGVSTNALVNISQALGALGSGDIGALSSNQSLQNLLAISSAGSFGGLLTGGLTSKNTNQLLYNLVTYLGGIQGNNVVKTQLAQIFGMSRADIEAIANLTPQDMQRIFGTNLTYGGAVRETGSQLGKVGGRMHVSELISNVVSNMTASLGGSIANNPASYAAWLVTDMLEKATGGTNIPAVFAMGSGLDLNATVEQLMKLGIMAGAGIGTGMVGKAIGALSSGGSLNLSNWNAQDSLTRGGGFTGIREGVSVDVSSTQYIGSSSSSDIYNQTVTAARDAAAEEVKSSVEEEDVIKTNIQAIRDILDAVISGANTMKVEVQNYGLTNI